MVTNIHVTPLNGVARTRGGWPHTIHRIYTMNTRIARPAQVCASVRAVKYLYKYVHKGHARLMYRAERDDVPERIDEVKKYLDARVIGSACASWHLQGHKMFKRFPAVMMLDVHEEDKQRQCYEKGTERELERKETTLTMWLKYLKHPPTSDVGCRDERYLDFLDNHTYTAPTKLKPGGWRPRKSGVKKCIGSIFSVPPTSDKFYLRVLLTRLNGSDLDTTLAEDPELRRRSYTFTALRSAPDEMGVPRHHETYKAACAARGLLSGQEEWEAAMETSASEDISAAMVRDLFVAITVNNTPQNPNKIFGMYWRDMAVDLRERLRIEPTHPEYDDTWRALTHVVVDAAVQKLAGNNDTTAMFDRPTEAKRSQVIRHTTYVDATPESRVVKEEQVPDPAATAEWARARRATATPSQEAFLAAISTAVNQEEGGLYFVDAPGGTGARWGQVDSTVMVKRQLDANRVHPLPARPHPPSAQAKRTASTSCWRKKEEKAKWRSRWRRAV
jgi:hypothetical protein